ncbi:hypothetical protein BDZ97DRAFT_1790991 [Flammula alnicola]|nr:hypothetical protein BDZ97DRAFT_1790991 [Flammula alnicola]
MFRNSCTYFLTTLISQFIICVAAIMGFLGYPFLPINIVLPSYPNYSVHLFVGIQFMYTTINCYNDSSTIRLMYHRNSFYPCTI